MKKKKYKPGTALIFEPYWAKEGRVDVKHPLKFGELVYFLTDIPNVSGHCIVAKYSGEVVPMVHPEDFRIPTEKEL